MAKQKSKKAKHKEPASCSVTLPDLRNIVVTQQHIDDGVPRDPDSCAIALALKDVLRDAGVEFDTVSVDGFGSSFSCTIPVSTPVVVGGKVVESIDRTAQVHVALNLGVKASKFVQKFDEEPLDEDGNVLPPKVKPTSFKSRATVTVELQ